jgi:RNA polymerase sigma-70 factor, ECF subfamily
VKRGVTKPASGGDVSYRFAFRNRRTPCGVGSDGYRAGVDIRGSAPTDDDAGSTDDAILVARLRERDEPTFHSLVTAWSPVMLRVARGHVGSLASAEEVVQDTWLAVVRGLDAFEGRSALRTWVLRICANQAKRTGQRESRVRPSGLPSTDQVGTVEPSRFRAAGEEWAGYWTPQGRPTDWGPEAQALTGEVREVLIEAMQQLPERQAQVVALRDVHGLDSAEVAELVGTSEGNVRVLLHRGRAALREQLADYYSSEARAG